MTGEILSIEGLRHYYTENGARRLALAVDRLSVRKGEFLILTGPSGGGKSTLVNLIAGFFPATEGIITKDKAPVTGPGADRVVMFQNDALFPWLTALENISYGIKLQEKNRQVVRNRATSALVRVGLGEFANTYPATLSGGMRQRVALARALVTRPDILLLDEPFAALDIGTREKLRHDLVIQAKECGATVIMVTHDVQEAVLLADRIALVAPPPAGLGRIFTVSQQQKQDEQGRIALEKEITEAIVQSQIQ